ncbi:MAG: hypothetical protein HZB95_04805 [Nitrosomonadales bacterium]|nr:hypothetical protein [Nitrosomonadales bacterium]
MGVAIWKRPCIDRIHMSVGIGCKALYGFALAQLHGMRDVKSEIVPNGNITVFAGQFHSRMSYYPSKKRKIAEIEVGITKSKHKYFRLSLFPSQFGPGEFERFKEVLALMLPPFNYQKLYVTAKVSYIEIAADSVSQAHHSFIPFRAKCNCSMIFTETDGAKGSIYVGSKTSSLWFCIYDKKKLLEKKKLDAPHKIHTRIEARMKFIGLHPNEIQTQLGNPFLKLEIADLTDAREASKDKTWQSFLDECLSIGSAEALRNHPKQRKLFMMMLRNHTARWWKPDYVWSKLENAVSAIAP